MKKDFALTFLTQIIVMISALSVFKLAMVNFGDVGFAEFSLIKRNLAYIYTFILLGMGVAVPRFIALELGKNSDNEKYVYLSALQIMVISLVLTGILFFLFGKEIAFLFFGEESYIKFLFPIYVSIVGLSCHGIVYAYYRGNSIFKNANLLQIINLGLIPLISFVFAQNLEEVFYYTGSMMIVISFRVLMKIISFKNFNYKKNKIFIPKLLKYGIQRLPGDFGLASLLALPVILTSHTNGVVTAGYVAFSISLLSLSGQVVAPVGLIMLPKISRLMGENKFSRIQYYIKKLFIFSVFISVSGTICYQLFAEELLDFYLGTPTKDLIEISKTIMWGALFYPVFVTLRSVIDAYYTKAYNSISVTLSLAFFLLLTMIIQDASISLVWALILLVFITLYRLQPIYSRELQV